MVGVSTNAFSKVIYFFEIDVCSVLNTVFMEREGFFPGGGGEL